MGDEPIGVMKCWECEAHSGHEHLEDVPDGIEQWKYIYLAGLIDGEGSFTVAKVKRTDRDLRIKYEPYLQITSSNEEALKWLVQNFGGSYRRSGKPQAFLEDEERWIVRRKPVWSWLLHAEGCRRILPEVLPYLIIKKREAEVMLETLRRGDYLWGREQLLKMR